MRVCRSFPGVFSRKAHPTPMKHSADQLLLVQSSVNELEIDKRFDVREGVRDGVPVGESRASPPLLKVLNRSTRSS